jgi:hypothetical protein
MKKLYILLFLFFIPGYTFAQSSISNYISYLGKPVPDEFCRIDEATYENNNGILKVENNIVISSGWIEKYKSVNEAEYYYNSYCNLFISTGWTFFERDSHGNIYKYSNIYVVCTAPALRIDGNLTIMIIFYSEEYYNTLLEKRIGG